ncbi:MAG: UbiA prenyltransferase family protein [Thermoproteota archaeon]
MKLKYYILELRAYDWYKNLLVFAGLFFSKNLFNFHFYPKLFLSFLILSLISSSGYIINDIKDAPFDALHPKKKNRPIASGKISKISALLFSFILLMLSLFASYFIGVQFFILALSLFINSLIYSFFLKGIIWLDITSISLNYIIRSLAGCEVIGVYISPWLIMGVFYVAMLFALAKRREELVILSNPSLHRESLKSYNLSTVDQGISIFSTLIIISYSLYTINSPYSSTLLFFTIPLVTLVVLKFVSISKDEKETGIIRKTVSNPIVLISLVVWVLVVFYSIYLKG